jgi:transcriptional regulator GlxA family with amidase domain
VLAEPLITRVEQLADRSAVAVRTLQRLFSELRALRCGNSNVLMELIRSFREPELVTHVLI